MAPNPPKPEELPQVFRDIMIEYSKKIMALGSTILELLSEALGLDPSYIKEMMCPESLFIQGDLLQLITNDNFEIFYSLSQMTGL
ncbi:hypothetical protein P8452_59639 [Trifolium repens]|nr:hypothetical protein P8452_59639 [Trifolium repens]